ncbi:MAG TPA: ATP-binding cassette domain-containing protein [Pirellulales bacterium]|jgi:osmoprotectant transport system ATP-binding protein|nr:ATP-binding cassette domain-containing protein [Pirellulales bacterium]
MPASIELCGVSKNYGSAPALRKTDLSVSAGETAVLLGPSGCGKSTLLRLIIGLIRPDAGVVRIGDQELSETNLLDIRRRMGYVIQDGGLFPHLTARKNAALMARYLGWSQQQIDERMAELAELVRLPHERLDAFPSQLSGGQRQRVSLMRALMLDPEVLLLDEPLGALDPVIRAELQTDLRQICRTLGKTVVMVTHDLAEAHYFGHQIVLLRDGQIVQRDTFEGLVNRPADPFVSQFVNAQRMGWSGTQEGVTS